MKIAKEIIGIFGGLHGTQRALAEQDVHVAVTTVQGWKERNTIPQKYWSALIRASEKTSRPISINTFLNDIVESVMRPPKLADGSEKRA